MCRFLLNFFSFSTQSYCQDKFHQSEEALSHWLQREVLIFSYSPSDCHEDSIRHSFICMSPILASLIFYYIVFSFSPWEIPFHLAYVSLILFSVISNKFIKSFVEFSLEFCIPSYSFILNLFNLHCLLLEFSLYIYSNSHLSSFNTLFVNLFIVADFHLKIANVPSNFLLC